MTDDESTPEAAEIDAPVAPSESPFAAPTMPTPVTQPEPTNAPALWKRPITVKAWVAATVVLVAIATMVGVGVVMQARLDSIDKDLATANESITALEGNLDRALDRADNAEARVDEYKLTAVQADNDRAAAQRQRDAALEREQAAIDDMNVVLTRFDPEIKAALADIVATATQTACTFGQSAGLAGEPAPTLSKALVSVIAGLPTSVFPNSDPEELLPMTALQRILNDCYAAGKNRKTLDGPHGNGFFTVGVEISAGKWRSDGTGDGCYWKISPDGQPDNILNNHFGSAGGTVTLSDGQEFESDDCGTWTKV